MRRWALAVAMLLTSVLGAQGLAFVMLKVIPDPAVTALGIAGASAPVRAAYQQLRPVRSYSAVLLDLLHGRLGTTLDGVTVLDEVRHGLAASAPRVLVALVFIAAGVLGTALAPRWSLKWISGVARLLAFLPPFAAPFLALGLLMLTSIDIPDATGPAATICIALPPMTLLMTQAADITRRNLELPFAINIRALGASQARLRVRLLHNLLMELAPTAEKVAAGLLTALLFVEPILGLDGFGSLILRGVGRSDPDMVLGIVLVCSLAVNLFRLVSLATRVTLGVRS